jgi:paraquat-inducible protein B
VIFHGVQVGQVSQIVAFYDPQAATIRIKVVADLVRGSIHVDGPPIKDPGAAMEGLIQKGLRASLQMQSFVTGLLLVSLDFHPEIPIRRLGLEPAYPEIPTAPTEMERMLDNVRQAVTELGKLPLEPVLGELLAILKRVHTLLDLPEVQQLLVGLHDLVTEAEHLVQNADAQVMPQLAATASAAHTAMESLQATLTDVQKLANNIDRQVTPLAGSAKDTLVAARGALGQTQKSLTALTESAVPTLQQGGKAMSSIATLIGSESLVVNDLTHTLTELEGAARAIRILAEYLQRNPEALLRGKGR